MTKTRGESTRTTIGDRSSGHAHFVFYSVVSVAVATNRKPKKQETKLRVVQGLYQDLLVKPPGLFNNSTIGNTRPRTKAQKNHCVTMVFVSVCVFSCFVSTVHFVYIYLLQTQR